MESIDPFIALVFSPSTDATQARRAEALARLGAELRSRPGFLRAQVLVAEDGQCLVTATWWSDRESFEQFRSSDLGRAAAVLATEAHPKAFWLRLHADVEAP